MIPPPEPTGNARTLARVIRDHYDAFLNEGFTEAQSMELCKTLMNAGRPQSPEE